MGIGGALFEAVEFADGQILNGHLAKYRVPRFSDTPAIEVVLVDRKDLPSVGAGETPIMGIAAAIGNALYQGTGVRVRSMPIEPASGRRLSLMQISFDAPASLLFGQRSRSQLGNILRRLNVSRTLIVSDAFLRTSGLVAEFEQQLKSTGIQSTIFSEVQPDPTDENVAAGLECLKGSEAAAIVAIGGGSVIDAAKVIGVAATNPTALSRVPGI